MSQTRSLAEWFAFLSLGLSISSAVSVPFWLTYDADLTDFDPRPAVRHALAAVHQDAVYAGHGLNRAIATSQRTAARTAKRAHALLTVTPGATR